MDTNEFFINPTTHNEIVHNLLEKLNAYYVFPDIAEQISTLLQTHLTKGDYDNCHDGEILAKTLTEHIQEINHDKHLRVQWYQQSLPEPATPTQSNQELLDEWEQQAKLDNYGLHKVERLPGNVGYFDIRAFYEPASGGDIAVAAMNFLANASVLIIDLRKCRGGSPEMIVVISSYFFGKEPVHLNSLYWRDDNTTQQFWTMPHAPGRHFDDKPIYLLTSKDTFSGGEEFAYNLKTRKRATLVGETTGGGAHPGITYRLHSHFDVFIPSGRAINPITGTNWEGIGVTPDISTSQEEAFTIAYSMALKSIIENFSKEKFSSFNILEEAQTALKELEKV